MSGLSRRSFFRGLGAILAAPAVAKVTRLIPPLERARLGYLTPAEFTREAVRMFLNTNEFMANINGQYSGTQAKIGTQLRIRRPTDYRVSA